MIIYINGGQWLETQAHLKRAMENVTSRSGALRKFIIWGHLLASDLDYYTIKTFDVDYEALWVDDMLFYCIDIDGCY